MLNLPGYQITEQVYDDNRTQVYRGIRLSDNQPVAVKLLKSDYPSFRELVQFRHQYAIAKNLDLPGIVKPYSLENYGNGFVLVMEDFGGIPLSEYTARQPLPVGEFLPMARQIVQILAGLHHKCIIHKDIKPQNLLINPQTKEVKLIDFSIATLLPRETQEVQTPNVLQGTLAYIAPEQTGRMNRGIDYRSDFYSLGITFYELLTGQLPFPTTDLMELVHCHIAKAPIPPIEINPAIPQPINDIICKLIAKTAEDRYQSAYGVEWDLEICWQQWQKSQAILPFELGRRDISHRFIIPEKLYGRNAEVETLLAAFERVAGERDALTRGCSDAGMEEDYQSKIELMLVAGFSGIGKTAVVNEVHKPILRQRGYFIKGKFDQFNRNVPFSAFVQSFRDLMGQLLAESSEQMARWKAEILAALGENAQVIIEVIPELEPIVGKQPPVVELSGSAAQNRFNLLFGKFIRVFATAEHPLVIFLDDLQWADSASLKLMQVLLSESDMGYLLLIGAYRDNEVYLAHPLRLTLEEIQKTGTKVETITLAPLSQSDLNNLIADTLNCPTERAMPLTELVYGKTQGNPFFSNQFLKALHQDGLIAFDGENNCWECDLGRVRLLALTDDVVEFMASQLQKLPPATQTVLKLAACIGNQFDLHTLAIVTEQSQTETAADLWQALQEGLILPISDLYKFFINDGINTQLPISNSQLPGYKFLHDRVQQAAYTLIPPSQQKAIHLKIGRLLLQNTKPAQLESNIFEIVNHLNRGSDLIGEQSEKDELARLNLIAARKAKAATAYEPALKYLGVGLSLLASDSWKSNYSLTLPLYVEAVEAEYLNTNYERSHQLADVALQQAETLLDRVKVYEIIIQSYVAQNQMESALDTALEVLNKLGVSLPKNPSQQYINDMLPKLHGQQIEDLANLPEMTDANQLAAMRILMNVTSTAVIAYPSLLPLVVFTMVNLSIQHGNSAIAAHAYTFYGILLCAMLQDIDSGYRFGQLALQMLDKFDAKQLECKVKQSLNVCVFHWKIPARETVKIYIDSIQAGLETGDIEYACYAAIHYSSTILFIGEYLSLVKEEHQKYVNFTQAAKQSFHVNYINIWRQLAIILSGESSNSDSLSGEIFNEAEMLPFLKETNNGSSLFCAYLAKAILCYYFGRYEQAVENTRLAEQYTSAVPAFMVWVENNLYYSLSLLAAYGNTDEIQQVEANQKQLQKWASHAPKNYQHKYDLVEAERHRVFGKCVEAMDLYDRAIKGAKENEYVNEEALANELAAKFYLKWGKEKIAQTYLTDAYYCYCRWGSKAKIEELERRYPQLLAPILNRQNNTITTGTTMGLTNTGTVTSTSLETSAILDLVTVMKASQAISSEIELEKLMTALMQAMMENAGAEKGFLILSRDGKLLVAAGASAAGKDIALHQSIPVDEFDELPVTAINYVARLRQDLVLSHAAKSEEFIRDRYIAANNLKSLLCTPIINRGQLIGILYLENNLIVGAFTPERMQVVKLLSSQAAISLENAFLYANLETQVSQRTQELKEKNARLYKTLDQLKRTQAQMIQSEKMSSLGQIVGGVAHEINNPINFIYGNLEHANQSVQQLLELIGLYQQQYPETVAEIQAKIEETELDFLAEDLPKMLTSMKVGANRIRDIILSLRNFSRLDEASLKPVDIHEGIESTLLILQHRLKSGGIEIIKEYSQLPKVTCYAGEVNQVFLNILNNGIDALENGNGSSVMCHREKSYNPLLPTIRIRTEAIDSNFVRIRIADNGCGIAEDVRSKVFEPFFTTKPVGYGTGLGLFVSYQIMVEKHGGNLTCFSTPGESTEFIIDIPVRARVASARV
ncbi:trifunctional serine/threonine-protein kinase/ATP-binding protein/sensor histidine kinase [Microseira wollei]|uniref:histidine kinase n=1 Tax=Microseira wollei NIES-4236 TaxID=2530354 RepID=A0AAV3XFM2_9CYAN|nr:ATP-binding sensor histidine kinase [Microseira wollei]GET39690.1 multi-sensor signal transduction multi-kinase [Microseira wollei NIES-4236]